ncbi:MAG: hypothetical protein AAGI30_13605 [Planctomycetota bacterium]
MNPQPTRERSPSTGRSAFTRLDHWLQAAILADKLRPGDALPAERDLARDLTMSKGVRSAELSPSSSPAG